MTIPKIIEVKVTPNLEVQKAINSKHKYFSICPVWSDVERPNTGGWLVKEKYKDRMVRAILAGVVCTNPRIVKDYHNRTYVQYDSKVHKNTNADLKKLGF